MNVADGIAFGLILIGSVGLLFAAFLEIHSKFLKQYYVHWEDEDGNQSYSIIEAYSKNGAGRKMYKSNPDVCWVGKIVRDMRKR